MYIYIHSLILVIVTLIAAELSEAGRAQTAIRKVARSCFPSRPKSRVRAVHSVSKRTLSSG